MPRLKGSLREKSPLLCALSNRLHLPSCLFVADHCQLLFVLAHDAAERSLVAYSWWRQLSARPQQGPGALRTGPPRAGHQDGLRDTSVCAARLLSR